MFMEVNTIIGKLIEQGLIACVGTFKALNQTQVEHPEGNSLSDCSLSDLEMLKDCQGGNCPCEVGLRMESDVLFGGARIEVKMTGKKE
ncbi:hypothetical protein Tco_0169196 [Tanacetum coccineum]